MQTPQYQIDSLSALQTLPITATGVPQSPILGGIADIKRLGFECRGVPIRYPVDGAYLRASAGTRSRCCCGRCQGIIADTAKDVPKGSSVVLLGQVQTMNSAYFGPAVRIAGAIVLIYLRSCELQSWSDPFVIVSALPAALAGIVWMRFTTQTTLSVPALTGAIHVHGRRHRQQCSGDQLRTRAV